MSETSDVGFRPVRTKKAEDTAPEAGARSCLVAGFVGRGNRHLAWVGYAESAGCPAPSALWRLIPQNPGLRRGLSCPGPLGRMRSAISRFAAGNDDLDAPRRRHTPEMNLTDVELAALGLPLDQRRALALRLWESVELEPGDESVMVKPNLPIVVAARSGWILSGRFPP
jgi:hypothetical protein